jgi:hypothetical protein
MNEYPIPHGEHCDSCILRSCKSAFLHPEKECKPAFLHPEEEIQGLINLPQG